MAKGDKKTDRKWRPKMKTEKDRKKTENEGSDEFQEKKSSQLKNETGFLSDLLTTFL